MFSARRLDELVVILNFFLEPCTVTGSMPLTMVEVFLQNSIYSMPTVTRCMCSNRENISNSVAAERSLGIEFVESFMMSPATAMLMKWET